ncbi:MULTISPECIES: ribulose bisphosphate carboxylase small subunit [unclassified Coleofasciculus]|uniref:ribulose bisphosphate carboxylase small subunit n=1 Tax=unclassified Coleofasciculus TaxID=2692782 RepID=UPI00188060C8|nr:MULTISPECIES: ribulose bisphosphate carboxylase small subunit [unclassified Coleofasciculus]MBE9125166.1 ribulose bisphosphate carboxylase small subunit [Coleofasciculus sp. LEGE 07081]MBE9148383.1 ribulose bisphosphate carboxylase small subunit [Coleofasciculus sp. LEGE 07092]
MSYYISPRFLDKVSIHITKNFLDLSKVRVPLILGIHGRKGEGKSFQCELVFERMGIEVVHMSAGEMESPDAGDPARLIRLRYREAAELIKVHGKMCVLMINDLDAGVGRIDAATQYTVNSQLVNGTLMNIADKPTDVQLPGSYDSTPLHRVPIIVTGNDFSTLYAPLIRDGRMEKFYWEPDRNDRIGIVGGIFEGDGLSKSDMEELVDTFPNQSIDFFGALRSRLYDEQVRQFIQEVGIERVSARVVNSAEKPPEFHPPDFSLPHLIESGQQMVGEQNRVQSTRLAQEYNQAASSPAQGFGDATPRQEFKRELKQVEKSTASNGFKESSSQLSSDVLNQLRQLIEGGYRIGMEHADERRMRINSWKSCPAIDSNKEKEAIAALEDCLAEYSDEYVRLIGIDPKAKRRVVETVIQQPNGKSSR